MHFGTGIVDTVEDFGTQGSNPTDPALLDWLAIEFVKSGWDIRHMQKLIVTSATYRQSSKVSKEMAQRDPRNILLARMAHDIDCPPKPSATAPCSQAACWSRKWAATASSRISRRECGKDRARL